MGLGLLLGVVFTADGEFSDNDSYSRYGGDSSQICSYKDSCAVDSLPAHTSKGGCHKDGFAVDTMSQYFSKNTSKNICLPGKICD